jgi:hypothetical protein
MSTATRIFEFQPRTQSTVAQNRPPGPFLPSGRNPHRARAFKLYDPKSDRISARCAHTIPQLIRIFCRPPARMSRDGTRTPSPVRAPARMSRDGISTPSPVREPGQDSRTPSPVREPGQDSSAAVWQKPRIITRTGAGSSKLSSEI